MRCRFCLSPATSLCTFKVPDARIVFPDEIQELDLVRDDLTLIYRPVKKRVHVNGHTYAELKFAGDRRSVIVRTVNVRLPMLRMEIHPCGNPVCDIHQREIDEDVLQCPDHWPLERVYGVD